MIDHALIQRFALTRPLIFEDIEEGPGPLEVSGVGDISPDHASRQRGKPLTGHEVITEPTRTIIRADAESLEHDLPEMLSFAKLAEIDPMLCTMYSQPRPTEREMKYLGNFGVLCTPLKNAWTWRTMRETVPEVYAHEIAEMREMWERLHDRLVMQTGGAVNIDDPAIRDQMLGMWAVNKQDPDTKVLLQISGNWDTLPAWHRYIAVLEAFIPLAPDPLLYTILPDVTEADYRVRIVSEGNGIRVYDIREREVAPVSTESLQALDHLIKSIALMEQSKGAVKSKTIAQARSEAEKARAILEKML